MPFDPKIDNSFARTLQEHGLTLVRDRCHTLQVNTGLTCDLACRHCHLSAGPGRTEIMSKTTMREVIQYAGKSSFEVVDITGGAPELVPDLTFLIEGLAEAVPRVMLRTNLTALDKDARNEILDLCCRLRVALIASFPAVNGAQVERQRGAGVWNRSVATLRRLNELGYGQPGSLLELNLAANPGGAFLPQGQVEAERHFKRALADKLGITFNHLFVFANMPLGRFRQWLDQSGNLSDYMTTLAQAFNPSTVEGLMCRSLVSVAWDGTVYDCDFNQAADLPRSKRPARIKELDGPPEPGEPIATGEHCFACTAGSGFTCGGEIAA